MKQQDTPEFLKIKGGKVVSKYLAPSQFLVVGFLTVIMIGTILLMLPISNQEGQATYLVDALFTATSAVCVTGLNVVNTLDHWSTFGKVVILLCIQIGGIGFMTMVSMGYVLMGKRISLKNRLIMQEALNFDTITGIVKFARYVVIGTLAVEGMGALLLCFPFISDYGFLKGVGYAIFHSVSAFCNAGFALIEGDSLSRYVGNGIVNFTIISLIIIGGLGFIVWTDTYKMLKYKQEAPKHFTWKQAFYKLSVHTKLVWLITMSLLIGGFIFFFMVEFNNPLTLGALSLKEKIYAAMFHATTTRTAGFNTIPLASMKDASQLMTMFLMFVGGSPAGTAGGIKTVTVGVLVVCAFSTLKGRNDTIVFQRKIPRGQVTKALTLIMIAMTTCMVMVMILTFTEGFGFLEILYEVISALATVGITLGITPNLSIVGKCIIIIAMFIGRLGPITIALAMMRRGQDKGLIEYPEEKIMIG